MLISKVLRGENPNLFTPGIKLVAYKEALTHVEAILILILQIWDFIVILILPIVQIERDTCLTQTITPMIPKIKRVRIFSTRRGIFQVLKLIILKVLTIKVIQD